MRRIIPIFIILLLIVVLFFAVFSFPARASRIYGPPAARLTLSQRIQYSARMISYGDVLTAPLASFAPELSFTVGEGETVDSVAARLQEMGFISSAGAFRDYLIYTGYDTTLQAGEYKLSASMSIVDIARRLQDATPEDITFVVLAGWRMEEIAASLPTSGLTIAPEQFLAVANIPLKIDHVEGMITNEGFFLPDSYILPRATTANGLVEVLTRNFALHLTQELREGFAAQGLDVYQAVTLASLVQRESVEESERPQIASVFINRLNAGWKLDSDPTVQYAVGFNSIQNTWWTNPLSAEDLQIASPFNTYIYSGLPPAPIANPSLSALYAVAFPAQTPYFYFRARCDGSGLHNFATTLEEHIANACE